MQEEIVKIEPRHTRRSGIMKGYRRLSRAVIESALYAKDCDFFMDDDSAFFVFAKMARLNPQTLREYAKTMPHRARTPTHAGRKG